MTQSIEKRLAELRQEFASGQEVLAEMQKKQDDLRNTLLRISGAIQVLDELLQAEAGGVADAAADR